MKVKCKECNMTIKGGCYNTPYGIYCCECWEKQPLKKKEGALQKALLDRVLK